jgi:precorrin-6B methylase 1
VSSTTISSYQQACSRHRWEVPDGYNIAAHAFPYSYITGRVWALKDSQEM